MRGTWWAVAFVVISLVLAACTSETGSPSAATDEAEAPASETSEASEAPSGSATPDQEELPTIRIAASRGLVHMPIWNLVNIGPEYGFNVEMLVVLTYADQQQAVAGGDADIATTGVNMPSIAVANGIDNIRIVAGQHWAGQNLVMREGVELNSWSDLVGKTIGVAPGTWARVLFFIAAAENGVDLNQVDLLNIEAGGATPLQALQREELDGFVLFAPTTDQAVVEGYGYYPENVDIGDSELGDANGAIYASTDFLADDELALNFMRAFVDSLETMASDEEAFVQLGVEVAGVSEDVARESYSHIRYSYNIEEAAFIGAAELGPEFGYADQDYSEEVVQLLDYSLLEEVTGKSRDELVDPPR